MFKCVLNKHIFLTDLNANLDDGMDLSDFLPFGQSEEMKSFQRADFEEFWRNANDTQEISEEERKLFPKPPEKINSSYSNLADFNLIFGKKTKHFQILNLNKYRNTFSTHKIIKL